MTKGKFIVEHVTPHMGSIGNRGIPLFSCGRKMSNQVSAWRAIWNAAPARRKETTRYSRQ